MADLTLNIISNMSGATAQVNEFTNAMKRATSAVSATGASVKKTGIAVSTAASHVAKLGHSANKTAGFFGKLNKSLARIAVYRTMRKAISYVGEAFKNGLEAAYQFSRANQPAEYAKLAGAMDGIKKAASTMSLQLGAAFGGLITAIAPILIRIINLVTQAADAITRFFAVLNGTGYYKKASEGFEEVGNSAGGAGKKIKGLLASWDELNVIGKESGGGGGGSNEIDYSGAYEWAEAESDWAELFASGNFFGIGAKIGDALGDVAQKITNFLKKPEIQNFGKNLADALNGSVSDPSNWESIGEAIGTAIGTATKWICDFFNNVDWASVKTAIVAFVVGLKVSLVKELDGQFDYDKPYWQEILDWILPENLQPDYDNPFSGILEDLNRMWEDTKQGWEDFVSLISTPFKKVKIKVAQYFNDIYVSWLETKQSILDSLNDLPDWVTGALGISGALENNAQKLLEAKQRAEEYKKALDELDGKKVETEITVNSPNTTTDSWYSRIKQRIAQKTASDPIEVNVTAQETSVQDAIHQIEYVIAQTKYKVDIDPEVKNPIEAYSLFTSGGGITSQSSGAGGGGALVLRVLPEIKPGTNLTIPSTANYTDWEVHGSKSGTALKTFTTWKSTANYTDWSVAGSKSGSAVSNFTTWNSTANWKNQKVDPGWMGTTWNSTANWKNQKTDPAWGGTTWNSTANWKNQKTDPKWAGTTWNSTANFIKRTMASTFDTTFDATANVTATINKSDLRKQFKDSLNGIKININSTVDGVRKNIGNINTVAEYAEGGWPSIGDLFIANEAGPEYVASIGNKTAVANNDDIVQGIQGGVERANAEQNELLRQQNSILAKLLNKELTINPSVSLGQVVARSTAMYGRA